MAGDSESVARKPHCRAGLDGDCWWKECPQEANNRENWQEYCPLATADDAAEEEVR